MKPLMKMVKYSVKMRSSYFAVGTKLIEILVTMQPTKK